MLTYFLIVLSISVKFSYVSSEPECGISNEALLLQFVDTQEEKFVCPASTDEEQFKLDILSKYHYQMGFCLWSNLFTQNMGKLCLDEVKPVFRIYENKNNQHEPCSLNKNQFWHYFGYYYCGDINELGRIHKINIPKDKPFEIEVPQSRIIPMYNVCFDVSKNKAVWTQHSLETPQLLQNPENEQDYCATEISKEPFFTDEKFFQNLEKRYESAGKKGYFSDVVLPQPLVPADHFALRLGKKATNHYINRRPLWDKLIPLMTAIDQGIKKAVIKASLEIKRNGPADEVLIYTKTKTVHSIMTRFKKWFKIEPFEPNIWYKFVYDPVQSQGIIIYVHNTPGKTVVKKCEEHIVCNFKQWTKVAQIRNEITEELLKYAYCCPITAAEARKEFAAVAKDFEIVDDFDINSLASH